MYVIKCTGRGKYWERRIIKPEGTGKLGKDWDVLKRKHWKLVEYYTKRIRYAIVMSCFESHPWLLICIRFWILLKLFWWLDCLWSRHYSDSGQGGSLFHKSSIDFIKSSFHEVECLVPIATQWHFVVDLKNWLFPAANHQSFPWGLSPGEMQSGGNSTIPHSWHLFRNCNFPHCFDINFLFFYPHGIPMK